MRRLALPGLIAAVAFGLWVTSAEAWSPPVGARPARTDGARYGSPFATSTLGDRQNEAWGQYLRRQYFLNNPSPGPHARPHPPRWAWVGPSWQWNGWQWVWVPGYWVPTR